MDGRQSDAMMPVVARSFSRRVSLASLDGGILGGLLGRDRPDSAARKSLTHWNTERLQLVEHAPNGLPYG